jgi:hypothetical protein
VSELDPDTTQQLIVRLAAAVRTHYQRTLDAPDRSHVYEALNALATVVAIVLTGTDNPAEVREWFEAALDAELADLDAAGLGPPTLTQPRCS